MRGEDDNYLLMETILTNGAVDQWQLNYSAALLFYFLYIYFICLLMFGLILIVLLVLIQKIHVCFKNHTTK